MQRSEVLRAVRLRNLRLEGGLGLPLGRFPRISLAATSVLDLLPHYGQIAYLQRCRGVGRATYRCGPRAHAEGFLVSAR